MITIILVGFLILISIVSFILLRFLNKWISIKERSFLLDHYQEIISTFEQAKIIAYKKVWQEEIAVESVSGFNIKASKLKTTQNKYVRLVTQFCGPAIINDLELMHGSIDSLILFLISGFIAKLNEDEQLLRQTIVDGSLEDEGGEGKMFVSDLIGPTLPSSS